MTQEDAASESDECDIRARCEAAIEELNRACSWGLGSDASAAYLGGLLPHVAPHTCDSCLRAKIVRYHLDHDLVRSLADRDHPQHAAAWEAWVAHALRIVRSRYPDARQPPLAEAHDLAQDGLLALSQSLARFHYDSRFSTWAYAVVLRIAHRRARDLRAAKRAAEAASIESVVECGDLPAAPDELEQMVAASVLAAAAEAILGAHADARLSQIFRLWAIHDQRAAQIGALVRLSPSRVAALIAQGRALLRAHPSVVAWRDAEATG